jgi:hypothetical protein
MTKRRPVFPVKAASSVRMITTDKDEKIAYEKNNTNIGLSIKKVNE